MYSLDDTIIAISSALGPAARSVIRLSGRDALTLTAQIFQTEDEIELEKALSWFYLLGRCRLMDDVTCSAQLYIFREPHSYTTENIAELHLPGSPPLLQLIMEQILTAGARLAQPGEFTARAFFHNRIDMSNAEAVAAVINARSDNELRAANRLLDGALHNTCSQLSRQISESLAFIEANIDFTDDDIETINHGQLRLQLGQILSEIDLLFTQSLSWTELHHLPQVVVAGAANAGKSTLVNQLLGIDRSIVNTIAGTTRDLLNAPLKLTNGECMLIDTAGLDFVSDALSVETQRLARQAIATCDLLLWVFDASLSDSGCFTSTLNNLKPPKNVIYVANKIDLCHEITPPIPTNNLETDAFIPVSALRGDNLDCLKDCIDKQLRNHLLADSSRRTFALTIRQRRSLQGSRDSLAQAIDLLKDNKSCQLELLALELRDTLDNLGKISGKIVTEDILRHIFSRFCIGK